MAVENKQVLEQANQAIRKGDYEGFLSFCSEDTKWVFIGEQTLQGKGAVREYMKKAYHEPPKFIVEELISDGDFVCAVGKISMKEEGEDKVYRYCDLWRFKGGKMVELRAFVIQDAEG